MIIYIPLFIISAIVAICASPLLILGCIFVIYGFRKKKSINLIALKDKIIEASKTYNSINFRKLASIIGCKKEILLDTITQMVSSKALEASIEFPNIIFKKPEKFPELPSSSSKTPEATPVPGPPCLDCSRATRFIAEYNRYYCDYCKKYIKDN